MANIRPEDETGLPTTIWIHENTNKEKHNARIKVSMNCGDKINKDMFTITVPDKVIIGDIGEIKKRDVDLVKKWIDINLNILLLYWNSKISTNMEMANFRPKSTGLPFVIWIVPVSGKERHYARIKVSKKYGDSLKETDFFTVTVPDKEIIGKTGEIKSEDINLIKKWVDLNENAIIEFWNKDIDAVEFGSKIKFVG